MRKRILNILIEPSTVTELKRELRDVKSFGTIAYHLKKLENEKIVDKVRDTSKRGSPTTYKIINKKILLLLKEMDADSIISKRAVLKKIMEEPMIEDGELELFIFRSGLPNIAIDEVFECSNKNFTTLHYKITPKGLKFLEGIK